MKYIFSIAFLFIAFSSIGCGYEAWDGMLFYNLFKQTNISTKEYYPFLRDEYNTFYEPDKYKQENLETYPKGNILLWQKVLTGWNIDDVRKAVYDIDSIDWKNRKSEIEKHVKQYLEFANECSEALSFRNNRQSWDYSKLSEQKTFNPEALLTKANLLLETETNPQLKARYYYQIIRILHYSKAWKEAISLYNDKIKGKFPENEIYYYIMDQIGGCYYSTEDYEKAAYLFVKVFNNSYDRKKSAFLSYNFCALKDAEGKQYINGIEDEKDLLLIKSLQNFSDRISNIEEFIALDANDARIELLFMRSLNNVERNIWPKDIGAGNKTLPDLKNDKHHEELLLIADKQLTNINVKNKDFWRLASSYLSFINHNIDDAIRKLQLVNTFHDQKKKLSIIYQVFSWDSISLENENTLAKILKEYAIISNNNCLNFYLQEDWIKLILDKIANTYFVNNQIAKAFLVHNNLEIINYLSSYKLLDALETLDNKKDKSDFEKILVSNISVPPTDFINYIYYQKGIFYLYNASPRLALLYFNKNKSEENTMEIPCEIFSNNIKECFSCSSDEVMDDEVYKANMFAFIKSNFSRKELAVYLIKLEDLTKDSIQWKRKLANYLLGNYYFNISNTGYFRGLLNNRYNYPNHSYFKSPYYNDSNTMDDDEIINNRVGYNLSDIQTHGKKNYQLCVISRKYFENTIKNSSDNELNARCLYLIAKCELNEYYNNGSKNTFEVKLDYGSLKLPEYESFKVLKKDYSETKFHEMIIKECSYFRHYSALY